MDLVLDLTLPRALPRATFKELHHRDIDRPLDSVWADCLQVTASEIRTFGPLMAARSLPSTLRGREAPMEVGNTAMLDLFAASGFTVLRCDEQPTDGHASAILGAVGRFWSPVNNHPRRFASTQEFLDFDEPGYAKTVARLDAFRLEDGTTRVETETWIDGTDAASTRKFGAYWALIRLPSGLIRRSWLAAIDRRGR